MYRNLAARAGRTATAWFAITPGADPLPRAPTLGIYIPASVTSPTSLTVTDQNGNSVTFSVQGPGTLEVCPTHVTAGPSGLVGLTT